MKKILFFVLIAMTLVLTGSYANASGLVTGICSECHTMHNSEDGAEVASGGPYPHLIRFENTCIGCHTNSGPATLTQVDLSSPALPSGYFSTGAGASGTRHDVVGMTGADDTLAPPGLRAGSLTVGAGELTCAGGTGCHGTNVDLAIDPMGGVTGLHHDPDNFNTPFRFLYVAAAALTGKRSADWGETSVNHNVYYSGDGTNGISAMCGQCHGDFHVDDATGTGTASPWIRHPVDLALTELDGGTGSITVDVVNTPFGFTDLTSADTDSLYDTTDATVICLSCHRAHGSDVTDLLRWTYNSNAGSDATDKCLACHVDQR